VVFYEPKAMAEYTIGYIYFVMNRRDEARAAFGRALTEDLSFYPAHVALGEIARVSRDSATALQELQLAAELSSGRCERALPIRPCAPRREALRRGDS
jgi:tetratricopeptide (TPR) repeat protein